MSQHEIEKLDKLSSLLDSRYRIPGTGIRFGWDAILGLVPFVGDIATLGPSGYLVYKAWKLGARKRTIAKMGLNVGLDFVIGGVPILGDVFDTLYKANRRNFGILRRELVEADRISKLR